MTCYTGRGAQRFVTSALRVVSVAALLCFGAAPTLLAEPAADAQKAQEKQEAPDTKQSAKDGALSLPTVKVDPVRKATARKGAPIQRKAPVRVAGPKSEPIRVQAPSNIQTGS